MLLDLAKRYSDFVEEIEVERFRIVGASYELRVIFSLRDGSKLFVKDYLKFYPHHRHAGSAGVVEPSKVRSIEDVLKFIREQRESG